MISLIIILVITVVTAVVMNFFIKEYIFENRKQEMIRQGERVARSMSRQLEQFGRMQGMGDPPNDVWFFRMDGLIRGVEEVLGGRIWLMDANGKIYVEGAPFHQLSEPQLNQLRTGKSIVSLNWRDEKNRPVLAVALPIGYRGNVVGGLLVITLMRDLQRVQVQIRRLLLVSALIAALVAVLLAYYFSRHVTRPIHAMQSLIARMRKGDFSGQVEVRREDELGELARHFNDLNRELNETIRLLSTEQEQTQRIINSMAEGMISLNAEGAVVMINPAARRILQVAKGDRTDATVVLQAMPGLADLANQILQEKTTIMREIEHHGQMYQVTGSMIQTDTEISGVVIILQDVTNRWRLVELQKEVVANVSHEFKTPLTSIKGFVELMLDKKLPNPAAMDSALQVIHHETARLIRMVNDLLRMARLEALRLKKETVNLLEMVQNVVESLQLRLQDSEVAVDIDPALDREITLDPDRMEQVFYNLLDNAIRFSPAGTTVEVTLENRSKAVEVRIRDHGPGVLEAEQEIIFDRFYKVSKARSSNDSGFGLGLAIVKNIIVEHGGEIHVTNHPEGGAIFAVRLPV